MKRFFKVGLISLFLSLILLGSITVSAIVRMQSNGRLINYVGIVRGATQRLIKLELMGQPNDDTLEYLDNILRELNGAQGEYGLPTPDDAAYQQNLAKLSAMWDEVKREIYAHRSDAATHEELLTLSEAYFDQANDTVFAAEAYSARMTRQLMIICVGMLLVMLVTWAFIFWASSQKLLTLENTNRKLSDLTRRDTLTGVYVLSAFKERAQQLIDSEKLVKYEIVYTDFADFKYINDVFGYAYGDSVLSRYSEMLLAELDERELCGRVSADNFVLLLHYQNKEEVAVRQRRVDHLITEFMHASNYRQSLPTCCGICCIEDVVEKLTIDGLLDRANFARKTVKNGTNHNYVYYNESIRQRLREEKNIENRMLEALERREFTVHYQPKVDLKTRRVGCAEALVRWQTEDGGIIPPDRFIPVFEQKFMIDQLDRYVLEDVCRSLRRMMDEGKPVCPVSVNVSRIQFYDQNFVRRYVEIRDKYRIPPALLEIEFTESIVFDNAGLMLNIVQDLKAHGFSCSIDDFGKGYSSLSLLKDLPVDVVKIDSFFFTDGADHTRDLALVQGIVELLQKFHIHTVAEGIEEMEQVKYLTEIGCDYVQGYVFYRPMPQPEFESLLIKESKENHAQ